MLTRAGRRLDDADACAGRGEYVVVDGLEQPGSIRRGDDVQRLPATRADIPA